MALDCMAHYAIKTENVRRRNTISQHTKIFEAAFTYQKNRRQTASLKNELLLHLQINSLIDLKKFTALLFTYSGDFQRSALILRPSLSRAANIELLIFNVLIQSSALKTHSKSFLLLSDQLQGMNSFEEAKNLEELQLYTERSNCLQVVKYTMAEINCTMRLIMSNCVNSFYFKEYLWATFSMLPFGVAILFKEQIARDSLHNMKCILAYQMRNERNIGQESYPQKLVLKEFPLAKIFLEKMLEENFELIEYILPFQVSLRRRFFQQLEVVLICFYDQHKD